MSALPDEPPGTAPLLRVVTISESGEATEGCARCSLHEQEIQALRDSIEGLERDLNAWRVRYADLKRDKDAEARKDPLWPDAVRLFKLYKRLTGRPRLNWTVERFDLCRPFLKKHGIGMCERAVVGRVFEHYSAKRKNGTTIHYWEWERIFKDAREFEESCNRAPLDFLSELEVEDEVRAASLAASG